MSFYFGNQFYEPSLDTELNANEIAILKKADQLANRRTKALVVLVSSLALTLLLGIECNSFNLIPLLSYISFGYLFFSLKDEINVVDAKIILESYHACKNLKKMNEKIDES